MAAAPADTDSPLSPRAARLPAQRSELNSLPCAAVDNTRR